MISILAGYLELCRVASFHVSNVMITVVDNRSQGCYCESPRMCIA